MKLLLLITTITLTALAGCAVDQTKEVAAYRDSLDADWPAAAPGPAPDEVLTLRQALDMANRTNERLGLTGEDYLQSLIDRDRFVANLLPQIGIGSTYTRLGNFTFPAVPGGNGSLFSQIFPNPTEDVTGPKVHWNVNLKDLASVVRAEVMAKYRLALLLGLQADLLTNTAATYHQVLRLEQQIRVLQDSVRVQETRVADMQDKLKAGVARPLDVRQTEAEAAATRAALIEARNNLATARSGLAFLIGVAAAPNPLKDDFQVPEVPPVEELQKLAAAKRPDMAAADALVAAADAGLKAAFAEYLPSVSVDYAFFLAKQSFPTDSHWLFGLNVYLPLFSGGKIHADVRTAYSLVRQAAYYDSLTHRQVNEEVAVAGENLASSGRRIAERETAVAAAREAFATADQSYDVGLATSLERLVAQDRLLQAELALAAEELNRKTLYFRLVQAVGEAAEKARGLPMAQ